MIEENLRKVTIKPIKKGAWMEINRYKKCNYSFGPCISRHTGRVVTGLSKNEEKRLSEALNVDLSPESLFWVDYKIVFTDTPKVLNLGDPRQELDYLFLMADKRVAKSGQKTPYAEFMIYDEAKEAEKDNKIFQLEAKAMALYNDMSEERRRDMLTIYEPTGGIAHAKPGIINSRLGKHLKESHEKFVKIAEDNDFDIRVMLAKAEAARIVTIDRGSFYHDGELLGSTLDKAIEFLKAGENQRFFLLIKEKLETKEELI